MRHGSSRLAFCTSVFGERFWQLCCGRIISASTSVRSRADPRRVKRCGRGMGRRGCPRPLAAIPGCSSGCNRIRLEESEWTTAEVAPSWGCRVDGILRSAWVPIILRSARLCRWRVLFWVTDFACVGSRICRETWVSMLRGVLGKFARRVLIFGIGCWAKTQ